MASCDVSDKALLPVDRVADKQIVLSFPDSDIDNGLI